MGMMINGSHPVGLCEIKTFPEEGSLRTGSADGTQCVLTASNLELLPLPIVKVNIAMLQWLDCFHFPCYTQ